MADVFGAVVGAIALLQLSVKGARILQNVSEIESDFKDLCDEIDNIDNWVEHARSTLPSFTAGPIKAQIEQVVGRLRIITKDLELIALKLKREMDDGSFKVKKAKWLIKADSIAKLLRKARDAKQDLSWAVNSQQTAMMGHYFTAISHHFILNEQTVNAIHGHVMVLADRLPPSDVQPKESQRVEELPDSWTGANDEPSHKHAKQGDWTIAHTTTFKSTALLQQMMPGCPKDCRCGCHARPKRRRNEGLVGNLLGYLGVQYDLPSRDAGQDNRCICGEQIWRVEYRPPPWLDARVWLLSWSLGTAGPVYSLRPARVIPLRSILWTRIGQSAQAMRHSITLGDAVYPDDRNETGQELIETIITERSFDVLELLLVEWKNILRRKGFSRRAVWATNSCIQSWGDKLDDWQLGLLQQVLSYSETCEEPATSRVHQAAKQGHGMAEALQEDGWARDVLDSSGWASLHWAAFGGHVEAVQQLIDAGADVDVEDGDGWTPLMCAAIQSHPDCAHQLLNAGCCMDHTDMDGRTVLHVAAAYGLVDMVRMLLTADDARISRASASGSARRSAKGMAMAAAASWDGQLPLHHLAFSTEKDATAEAIEETARLLLDAHPDAIEARDEFGQTPARFAVVLDNLPLLRFLIRAGASLTTIDTSHYNLLHFIAAYASAPAIKLLLERGWAENQMPMIDHHVVNRWGRKSWDLFVHSMHESPWEVAPFRHAGAKVRFAFADLYCRIRDKNLRYDISVLKDALTALHGGHINAAQDQLCALARHKADCHNDDASAFYRGVGKQIDAGEIEAATVVIEEDLQHLDDELQSSPWDQESYFDYLASKSQWFEVSDTCFWIEPAAVFLSRGLHQEPNIEEQQNEPQSSHAQDETEAAQPDRYLDFNLITEIYSEEGQLLYDRETALCSPREFLDQFEPDFHDCKTQDDSESDASNAE